MKKSLLGIIVATSFHASTLFASDLMDIYRAALDNDPIFKQAYSTYMSNKEAIPQAQAALLPSVLGTGFVQRVKQVTNSAAGLFSVNSSYNASNYAISVNQAIFNYQAWMQVKVAKDSVKQAQAVFNNSAQDLMLRSAQAYFNVLQAKDNLRFTIAKKRANKRQLEQAEQRFKVGLDAITAVYEAQAAYDTSVSDEISDKNNLINQFENLRKITNYTYKSLAPLRDGKIPLLPPEPRRVADWVDTALKQNYALLAANFASQAARQNIKVQSSGNYPVINLQGNYTETQTDSLVPAIATKNSTGSIGLSLNFPVFQGGLVLSQGRQARYDYQTAAERLEQTYRDTLVNTRIAFNTLTDGISKIKADKQTIKSSRNSLDSTEAQFRVGTRTMVDVLDATEKLFLAQTQFATDQYRYINSLLQLKYLAGTLSPRDLEEINSWLATTRINSTPPRASYRVAATTGQAVVKNPKTTQLASAKKKGSNTVAKTSKKKSTQVAKQSVKRGKTSSQG